MDILAVAKVGFGGWISWIFVARREKKEYRESMVLRRKQKDLWGCSGAVNSSNNRVQKITSRRRRELTLARVQKQH